MTDIYGIINYMGTYDLQSPAQAVKMIAEDDNDLCRKRVSYEGLASCYRQTAGAHS